MPYLCLVWLKTRSYWRQCLSDSCLTILIQTEISQLLDKTAMELYIEISGPQNNIFGPQTFPLAPPVGQIIHSSCQ